MANERIAVVYDITKSLNKHGEIKGRNKKDKRMKKAKCVHHKYTHKMKLKPTIFNSGDGYCVCTICGKRFPTALFDDDSVKKSVKGIQEINEQAKYMSVATGAGKEAVEYFSKTGVVLQSFGKNYKKVRLLAQKQNSIKGKKKKKRGGSGSSQYGSWGNN